jgi:rhodanese-related sulfurtransferase
MSVVECSEVSADSVTPAFVHAALVPRRGTPVVCCDGGEGLAARAAARLEDLGYTDVAELAGGISAWDAAGYEVSADELAAMFERGEDLVVFDSRLVPEFRHFSIPGGVCCPGAELVYRVGEMAPDSETTVVVNCAGRTRSIIGAQSLIDAGIPNRVVALRNGIMGWKLARHKTPPLKSPNEPVSLPSTWKRSISGRLNVTTTRSISSMSERLTNLRPATCRDPSTLRAGNSSKVRKAGSPLATLGSC